MVGPSRRPVRRGIVAIALISFALPAARAERLLTADAYLDKVRGMWLAQLIGNLPGRPTEGVYNGPDPDPRASVPWDLRGQPGNPWPGDDDTDIEYLIQHTFLTHGVNPTPAQLRAEWVQHVPWFTVFIANRQARFLMDHESAPGVAFVPPLTGSYHWNLCWNAIDPQLTAESIGALSPGRRQWAVDRAGVWAGITTDGFPIHATQFYVAMYAAAFFESNVRTLIARGLETIPVSSRTAQVIRDVIAWHDQDLLDGTPDWRATRRRLYDNYVGAFARGRYVNWIESTVNCGATVLALLYGNGDFEQTVQIAILAGWDCDCNPASAAGLLGIARGYSGLPTSLTSQCGDIWRNEYRPDLPLAGPPPQDDSILAIAQRWRQIAEGVIVSEGGSITGVGAGRTYRIPDADPLSPPLERPTPTEPAGLVGEFRRRGAAVALNASVEYRNPANDRFNLDGIADGVSDPRYNGYVPYFTYDTTVAQPAGGDFYQFTFPLPVRLDRVIFHEGELLPVQFQQDPFVAAREGGFFLDLQVEARRDGVWRTLPNQTLSEPLDRFKQYQVIAFDFAPTVCDAVRIRGTAGGSLEFTSILELEAFGHIYGPALRGDLNGDGRIDFDDIAPFVLALSNPDAFVAAYPLVNPFAAGDANGDGLLNFDDIGAFVCCIVAGSCAGCDP